MVVSTETYAPNGSFTDYVRIARVDHWFKNIFMLPGTALAIILTDITPKQALVPTLLALAALCLAASANYVINEWLDAKSDQHHPVKKNRPAVARQLSASLVYAQYGLLFSAALLFAASVNVMLTFSVFIFLIMGMAYNIPPVRTKDKVYLDVLSESLNNPLRLIIGWSALVTSALPPSSILFAYWMGGAFLMAAKRFAEYRMIGDHERAASYRQSFRDYSEEKLLVSSFFYALCSVFFLGIFLVKYRIEFLLSFPMFALLFAWYLHIALREKSVVQTPEKLYRERRFMIYVALLAITVVLLFFIDIPFLYLLIDPVNF